MRVLPVVLIAACAGAPPRATPVDNDITMERTPCFGRCPVYTVTVQSTAAIDAILDRLRFFELDRFGKLPQEPVCTRAGNTTTCDFGSDTICSSTSSAIITVRRDGKVHKVTNDHCTPSPLEELETAIDDAAKTQHRK